MIFKKKSVIVKGLGIRPSSSLVTTASSNSSVEYIQRLENEIIELKEARARDQEERARDQEAQAKQEAWGHLLLVQIILFYTFCIVIKHLELLYVLQTIIVYLYGRSLNWILVLFFTYGIYGSCFYKCVVEINVLFKYEILIM